MLALDPPGGRALTVAEAFARPSPGRARTATARRATCCSGVALRLPDGSVVHGGGRVVKNVAGLRPAEARGRLRRAAGRSSGCCVRLHPLPAATSTVVADACDPSC